MKYKYILPIMVSAAVLFALVRVLQPVPQPISEETWDAVEKVMAADAWDYEPVIVHPVWEHSAFQRFPKHILSMGKPTNRGLYNYPRIWMIVARGAGATDYIKETHKLVFDEKVGEVRLQRWEKPGIENLVFDFFSNIRKSSVRIFDDKGSSRACTVFRNLSWVCPIREWNRVGQATVQVDGEWQSAVWHHPLSKWTTEARFDDVPMDERISGVYALVDQAAKKLPKGSKVIFRILIGDKVVGEFFTDSTPGWKSFEIDTSEFKGTKAAVLFQTSTSNDGMRHFCWRASVMSAGHDAKSDKKAPAGKRSKSEKDGDVKSSAGGE